MISNSISQNIILYISTCFKIGFLPKSPGTFGSLLAIIFLPLVSYNSILSAFLILFLFMLGIYASGKYATAKNNDPSEVVIDELVGQLLTFQLVSFFTDITLFTISIAFITFRIFDILKPWPICYFDKNLKGGIGIMFDDILAALMASFLVYIIVNAI